MVGTGFKPAPTIGIIDPMINGDDVLNHDHCYSIYGVHFQLSTIHFRIPNRTLVNLAGTGQPHPAKKSCCKPLRYLKGRDRKDHSIQSLIGK
jgi:hypothetical protein